MGVVYVLQVGSVRRLRDAPVNDGDDDDDGREQRCSSRGGWRMKEGGGSQVGRSFIGMSGRGTTAGLYRGLARMEWRRKAAGVGARACADQTGCAQRCTTTAGP